MSKPAFDPSKPYEEVKPAFDPSKPFEAVGEVLPEKGKGLLAKVSEKYDRYALAPMRAAYGKYQEGLAQPSAVVEAVRAGYNQFGEDPKTAPTVDQLLEQNPVGRVVKNKEFQTAFAQTPQFMIPSAVVGEERVGKLPEQAAKMLVSAETDPMSYVPAEWMLAAVPGPVKKVAAKGAEKVISGVGRTAERLAERATGATGKALESLKPGTGRGLLDRGIIKFGQSTQGLAKASKKELERSGEEITAALTALDDAKAAPIEKSQVVGLLKKRADDLSAKATSRPVARKLQKIIDDFDAKEVADTYSLMGLEGEKRALDAGVNWTKPNTTKAQAEAANVLRGEVERAAVAADPKLAEKFVKEKETYGLLKPVVEAAEKKANQLQQSQYGGLLDITSGAAGTLMGSSVPGKLATGIAGILARRAISPRVASSAAVTANTIERLMKTGMSAEEAMTLLKVSPGLLRKD